MKRIITMLTVAALMVASMTITAGSAFAYSFCWTCLSQEADQTGIQLAENDAHVDQDSKASANGPGDDTAVAVNSAEVNQKNDQELDQDIDQEQNVNTKKPSKGKPSKY